MNYLIALFLFSSTLFAQSSHELVGVRNAAPSELVSIREGISRSGGMGNGGDTYSLDFLNLAEKVVYEIKRIGAEYTELAKVDIYFIEALINGNLDGSLLVLSEEKLNSPDPFTCALVYPSIQLIQLKKSCWDGFEKSDFKQAFVLHTLLSLTRQDVEKNMACTELMKAMKSKN